MPVVACTAMTAVRVMGCQIRLASAPALPMYVEGVSDFRRALASAGNTSPSMNACSASRVIPVRPRVRAFSCS